MAGAVRPGSQGGNHETASKFYQIADLPDFHAIIGLIVLLTTAIGVTGYFEFTGALKQQYMEIANGIAEYLVLGVDASALDGYLVTRMPDEAYAATRAQMQYTADAVDCSVIYVAKVHTDSGEWEYINNVVSQTSGFSPMRLAIRMRSTRNFCRSMPPSRI